MEENFQDRTWAIRMAYYTLLFLYCSNYIYVTYEWCVQDTWMDFFIPLVFVML